MASLDDQTAILQRIMSGDYEGLLQWAAWLKENGDESINEKAALMAIEFTDSAFEKYTREGKPNNPSGFLYSTEDLAHDIDVCMIAIRRDQTFFEHLTTEEGSALLDKLVASAILYHKGKLAKEELRQHKKTVRLIKREKKARQLAKLIAEEVVALLAKQQPTSYTTAPIERLSSENP